MGHGTNTDGLKKNVTIALWTRYKYANSIDRAPHFLR